MLVDNKLLINESLCFIVDELDLPESKYELAIERYKSIGLYLGEDKTTLAIYSPEIFSQGSFRLGTIIKPHKFEEYDIDLVCKLNIKKELGQNYLYDLLGRRLKENETYRKMLKPKRRCWRLEYANEFHMDILPAIPDSTSINNSLLIPDKELKTWHNSNPKDYAKWFEQQMSKIRGKLIYEAKADIAKVPFYKYKTPLQRAVQILKRQRDIFFDNDTDNRPGSIIITTLAAKAYQNESDLFDALINIINGMPNQVDHIDGRYEVLNPVNNKENFADKWKEHPEMERKFFTWLTGLSQSITNLLKINTKGQYIQRMGELFGKDIFSKIVSKQEKKINECFGVVNASPIIISNPPKPWKI